MKKIFVQGPISPEFIASSIAKHQVKTEIGAHGIFLGQVRADRIGDASVEAIDYTAYEEMAEQAAHRLREVAFERFGLTCLHLYHSLGRVGAGEICLFVFTSSPHRQAALEAVQYLVEGIKRELPIFGQECLSGGGAVWKKPNAPAS